jgi:cyclopropane-fatty-acyl-phospholipid synthase
MLDAAPFHPTLVTDAVLAGLARDLPPIAGAAFRLAHRCRRGRLDLRTPDGRWWRFAGEEPGRHATMLVHDWRLARRALVSGDIGVAEGYVAGEWESPDLTQFLRYFCENTEALHALFAGSPAMRLLNWARHVLRRNSRPGARRNIEAHYDLGNAFYAAWLDETMSYSAALFEDPGEDLAVAQTRKYRALAAATGLRAGEHVLEIGCGWGGFAEFAARELAARVTGLTISREQRDFAARRLAAAGLSDRAEIRLEDYRDARGAYDRVVSIEMIEAVGEAYWPAYFRQLARLLKPGGTVGLQAITIDERLFPHYRREIDFIRRYVFPGGMLPTLAAIRREAARAGLSMEAEMAFGGDYALTVARWRERFRAAWPRVAGLGFDERFRRLWEYYLHYCEAGFLARTIDVRQIVLRKPG